MNIEVPRPISCLKSNNALAEGIPPLAVGTLWSSEPPCNELGSYKLKFLLPLTIASCNSRIGLLAIRMWADMKGGSREIWGGDVLGSGGCVVNRKAYWEIPKGGAKDCCESVWKKIPNMKIWS